MSLTEAAPSALDGSIETESEPVHWHTGMFLTGDPPANLASDCIDTTGRARFLVFGPFAPMEAGFWRAAVSLELCPDAARSPLALQFGVEPDYATVEIPGGMAGPHRIVIDHEIRVAGLGQARLWLKKAAFHGEIRFLGATVQRLRNVTPTPLTI